MFENRACVKVFVFKWEIRDLLPSTSLQANFLQRKEVHLILMFL